METGALNDSSRFFLSIILLSRTTLERNRGDIDFFRRKAILSYIKADREKKVFGVHIL